MTIYQLASSSATAASSLATCDVQFDGSIVGVGWTITGASTAGSEAGQKYQCAFGSVYTSTNDSRQVISNASAATGGAVAATVLPVNFTGLQNVDIPVTAGERLFLHSNAISGITAPASVSVLCTVYVDDKSNSSRRRP